MLKQIVVAIGKLIVPKKAVEEMGEFTGVFKEQEWEQSWSNMLTLWRGSFYHWQVTLSGNKARKWFGCV